jgi:hypothetical protein
MARDSIDTTSTLDENTSTKPEQVSDTLQKTASIDQEEDKGYVAPTPYPPQTTDNAQPYPGTEEYNPFYHNNNPFQYGQPHPNPGVQYYAPQQPQYPYYSGGYYAQPTPQYPDNTMHTIDLENAEHHVPTTTITTVEIPPPPATKRNEIGAIISILVFVFGFIFPVIWCLGFVFIAAVLFIIWLIV